MANNLLSIAGGNDTKPQDELKNLTKQIKALQKQADDLMKARSEIHGPSVVSFLDTPVDQYDDFQKKLADLNPDLFADSKKIDSIRTQMDLLENDKLNLQKALSDMRVATIKQKQAVEQGADAATRGIAQQKAVQMGAAQGLAGNQGATTGMLAKAAAQIANQYAPMREQVEAQRQQGLANVAAQEASIPAQMSAIQAQNLQNEAMRAQLSTTTKSTTPATKTYDQLLRESLQKLGGGALAGQLIGGVGDIDTTKKTNKTGQQPNYVDSLNKLNASTGTGIAVGTW